MSSLSLIKDLSLPLERVRVTEDSRIRRQEGVKYCVIDENIRFKTDGLRAYCFAGWDHRVFDILVVAAAIQFCDHVKARSIAGWGRAFEVEIPVHDPDLWNSLEVSRTLHDALTILTGDQWQLRFVQRKRELEKPPQSDLPLPRNVSTVIPYSDGLDSRSVAGLIKTQRANSDVMRVRLGSKRLGSGQKNTKEPFALLPYKVSYSPYGGRESSGRSRGFRFAVLSGIAAFLAKATEVTVSESGQGAIGPTLVTVGQGYDDYRNHPIFTRRMEALFAAIFNYRIEYKFPRLWSTKGETLAAYLKAVGPNAAWKDTWSCWQSNQHVSVDGSKRQCGICAACMLRRLSVYSAGEAEATSAYVWEDLGADTFEGGAARNYDLRHPHGAQFHYAIAGTLHLQHLAELPKSKLNAPVLSRKVRQLAQVLKEPESDVSEKLFDLLNRHSIEWRSFVKSLGQNSFVAKWIAGDES